MLQVEGQTLVLGTTSNRVILDGQGRVKQRLALHAQVVLDACQRAALVGNAADVVIVDTLGDIG